MSPVFTAFCLRDVLRKARLEGVSADLIQGNPVYDDSDVDPFFVDPSGDIRDSRLDKAERAFIQSNNERNAQAAAEAANDFATQSAAPSEVGSAVDASSSASLSPAE